MSELYDINEKGELRLHFHIGQAKVWQDQARFILMLAGTQGGKTSFGPWWLWREIYGMPGHEGRGQGDYIAATSSFDLFNLKMLPEMRKVFEEVLKLGRFHSGARVLELRDPKTGEFWANSASDPMWGRIILRSANAPSGLESATAKAAWLDEVGQDEWTLETWEAIQRRMAINRGRVLGTTTAYYVGWQKYEWYDRWADGDADYSVVQFASYKNPSFPKAEYDRAKRTLPAWRFKMFYRGEFSRPENLIYHDFDDSMLIAPFRIPSDWRVRIGLDFGGANTSSLYLAEDPQTKVWYAFREFLGGDMSSREHAERELEQVQRFANWRAYGGALSEGQPRRDWEDHGFPIDVPLVGDVEAGISRVIELIKSDRLRVFTNMRGLRDELGSYHRKLNERGEAMDEIADKRTFHRLDALRYVVSSVLSIENERAYVY